MPDEPLTPGPRTFSHEAVQLLRSAQTLHTALGQMVDQKASILLGGAFVTFTITVGRSSAGEGSPALYVLGGAAFVAAVFAVLAVLPSTRSSGPVNLMFFGSFVQLSEDEYVERVLDVISTDEGLFRAMAVDVHRNGTVLARRRYRMLGLAYRTFLAGLTLAAVLLALQVAGVVD